MKHLYVRHDSLLRPAVVGQLVLPLLFVLFIQPALAQSVRFVTPNGAGSKDGTSWANAMNNIQQAINSIPSSTTGQVWIARGLYKPGGDGNTDRTVSFELRSGVLLYGGFSGKEQSLNSRPNTFPSSTTLSGNIGNPASSLDNSYHVIRNNYELGNGTTLDGLVIANGQADDQNTNNLGGGLFNMVVAGMSASLTLRNCYFTQNYAKTGGAVVSYVNGNGSASFTFLRCVFDGNTAKYGGGATFIGRTDFSDTERYLANTGPSSAAFKDCVFKNNVSAQVGQGEGGAVFLNGRSNAATSTFERCQFLNNTSPAQGGAIYNLSGAPSCSNCSFVGNVANQGGVMYTWNGQSAIVRPTFTNCTFTDNQATGVGTEGSVFWVGRNSAVNLTNSIVYNNGSGSSITIYDTGLSSVQAAHTLFNESVSGYTGSTNFVRSATPFSNLTTLEVFPCPPMLNGGSAGTTSTQIGTTDLNGNPRFVGTSGQVDLGAVEFQTIPPASPSGGTIATVGGATTVCAGQPLPLVRVTDAGFSFGEFRWERIQRFRWVPAPDPTVATSVTLASGESTSFRRIATDCAGGSFYSNEIVISAPSNAVEPGTISGPSLVPYKLDVPLSFSSVTNASAAMPSSLNWQYSSDNGVSWTSIANSNSQTVGLPDQNPAGAAPKQFQYRRTITNGCSVSAVSNQVAVRVIRNDAFISGKVVSQDGTSPVPNVTITIVRTTTGLAGSPGSRTYTAVTNDGTTGETGTYQIPVYWGFADDGPVSESQFVISASYPGHTFSPAQNRTLNRFANTATGVNFTDYTTYGITGQVFQTCADCITGMSGQTPTVGLVGCPLDSVQVDVRNNTTLLSQGKSGFLDGLYGKYALVVQNPGSYTVSARYGNLAFTPPTQPVVVTSNVYNLSFTSPTSRTVTGRLTAGCNEVIGAATLEFSDVLPKAADGTTRTSCFRKRVTTQSNGYYQVVLPARKFAVRVVSFTATQGGDVAQGDLLAFFGLPQLTDSLTRDLSSTTAVTTLNLVYERPPQLVLAGLPGPPACNPSLPPIIEQAKPYSLSVTVFQGSPTLGCRVPDPVVTTTGSASATAPPSHTLLLTTAIRTGGVDENLSLTVVKGMARLPLVPGTPNVAGDFRRTINVQYIDAYGRSAQHVLQPVIVTGYRSNSVTFATVSPEVPLLVLHDPPGDQSYSFWEREQTQSQAMRLFGGSSVGSKTWVEVKLGTKLSTGVGVETEDEFWGIIGGNVETSIRQASGSENIVTTTIQDRIATSGSPDNVGDGSDLFIGGAMNMIYSTADVISLSQTQGSCRVVSSLQLVIAPDGFRTQFYYTENEIRTIQLKKLQDIVAAFPPNSTTAIEAQRQIAVWEQVLQDNANRKKQAKFERNLSFGSGAGEITRSTTQQLSKSSSIEFQMDIATEVMVDIGFEIAGSGASGGYSGLFRMETGGSTTTDNLTATTTGYTLSDNDPGDLFSVDVLTDPVYATPVFRVVAAETSCPREDNTIGRDMAAFNAPVTVRNNVDPNGTAEFSLNISNISQVVTDPSRTFVVQFDASSNPGSAIVLINGSANPVAVNLNRMGQATVNVTVQRPPNSLTYTFEGLRFRLVDDCDSDLGADGRDLTPPVLLSAFFQSPCSSASLVTPEAGWISTQADNDRVLIVIGGYTVANLSSITLQYREVGNSNWLDAFSLQANELTNSPNGTNTFFNTSSLADKAYSLRLKIACPTGNGGTNVVFSSRSDGLIDRQPPVPFGNTLPINDSYVVGSTIGITYNEPIACRRLTNANVIVKRVSDGQVIPMSVGCSGNGVVLVPLSSLAPNMGDVLSVTLTNVADQYGNLRTTPDIWRFTVGGSSVATGSNALSVTIANSPLAENATGVMQVTFRLPHPVNHNVLVNFNLAGTATFGTDYTVTASSGSVNISGGTGTVVIPGGSNSVSLLIDPINDALYEPDETVAVSLLDGGDYGISAALIVTGTILNDDPVTNPNVITSVRTGNWEDPDTWDQVRVPVATDQVILDQNHTVTLSATGNAKTLTPRTNARLQLRLSTSRLRLGF